MSQDRVESFMQAARSLEMIGLLEPTPLKEANGQLNTLRLDHTPEDTFPIPQAKPVELQKLTITIERDATQKAALKEDKDQSRNPNDSAASSMYLREASYASRKRKYSEEGVCSENESEVGIAIGTEDESEDGSDEDVFSPYRPAKRQRMVSFHNSAILSCKHCNLRFAESSETEKNLHEMFCATRSQQPPGLGAV